ncbi:MAG: DUF6491 family protein [Caulobacteraceae bacterium]|nr:DUF6491 family protein [Caulobacteraceae bacterium]
MPGFRNLMMIALAGAVLAPAAVLAQPAAPSAPAKPADKQAGQCFYANNVNGFNAPDNRTVYIRVGVRDVYRLDLMSDCLNLTFRQSLGLRSTPGSSWICSPLDVEVVYHDVGMRQRCPVTAIHKLTPAEVEALPKKDRP